LDPHGLCRPRDNLSMLKIVNVAGARPNFVKIAPVVAELRKHPSAIASRLVHTGQHYDKTMSDSFFRDLEIPEPDVHLDVGSGTHAQQTAEIMKRFEPVVMEERPDYVLVVGDVNSTVACALTAAKLGVGVIHVEAGLRSFDRTMPEEINRVLTDHLSDLLFVTEESGRRNLLKEGIGEEKIHLVGNVMIDSLRRQLEVLGDPDTLPRFGLQPQGYGLVTLHRPSNVDESGVFEGILSALRDIARRLPLLFPIHPRTESRIAKWGFERFFAGSGLIRTTPLGYKDCLELMRKARIVLTDSGGIQEETTVLSIPCLTIRNNTERPSTIEVGTNHLVGTDPVRIVEVANGVLDGKCKAGGLPPLWDGRAAERIAEILLKRECRI
jgi:UDP-N-acetylglucosamine 2-epimerase (non-hydrolysing)